MVGRVKTIAFLGIESIPIDVQVQFVAGHEKISIVGLPDKAVEESRERLTSVFTTYGIALPNKRIVVNLSPADVPKEGSHYDLPIALAILVAMGILTQEQLQNAFAMGELALDGGLLPTVGVLPAALLALEYQKSLICPKLSAQEATWSGHDKILAPENLLELINHFHGKMELKPIQQKPIDFQNPKVLSDGRRIPNWAEIKGQESAKRAMEIAAVGGHHILLSGSPGAGKSLLAQAMAGILPTMTPTERLETSLIHSLAGDLPDGGIMISRPYRDPHHSASMPAVIGGGQKAKPGEISLAHQGVLFLDELPEFNRTTLEALRQPLETGKAVIARVNAHVSYPADFQLVAAMNPCKCGHLYQPKLRCSRAPKCGEEYLGRLSGPLLDRIDLFLEVEAIPPNELSDRPNGESTEIVRARVERAVNFSRKRMQELNLSNSIKRNAALNGEDLERACPLTKEGKMLLTRGATELNLSARGWYRTIRVARSIADLEQSPDIKLHHLAESLNYRFRK